MAARQRVCACCSEVIGAADDFVGDRDTYFEGKLLCESCYYDDEPMATIYYRKEEEPYRITLSRNETDGDFRAAWRSSDAWRGGYELQSGKYQRVFSDAILSYHESEVMLKELNDKAIERFSSNDIDFCRAFLRTSNVFCTDYDIWVLKETEQILIAHLALERIKQEINYGNPLYSTGIIFDREVLHTLQEILGHRYKINTDSDVLKLIEEKGESLLLEIRDQLRQEPA